MRILKIFESQFLCSSGSLTIVAACAQLIKLKKQYIMRYKPRKLTSQLVFIQIDLVYRYKTWYKPRKLTSQLVFIQIDLVYRYKTSNKSYMFLTILFSVLGIEKLSSFLKGLSRFLNVFQYSPKNHSKKSVLRSILWIYIRRGCWPGHACMNDQSYLACIEKNRSENC